jgi:hypothetical protein
MHSQEHAVSYAVVWLWRDWAFVACQSGNVSMPLEREMGTMRKKIMARGIWAELGK